MPHLSPKTHIPACLQIDKGATSIMINRKNIAIYKLENPTHGLSRDIIVIHTEITPILYKKEVLNTFKIKNIHMLIRDYILMLI